MKDFENNMKKGERQQIVDEAIGENGDSPMKEATIKKDTQKKRNIIISAAFAAVAMLIALITITCGRGAYDDNSSLGNDYLGGNSPESSENNPDGNEDSLIIEGATLRQVSREGDLYYFTLVITEKQNAIDVTVRGEGIDEWGEHIFVISTTADFAELTHIPKAPPKITVDGSVVTKIPTAPGEYNLVIDLSTLDGDCSWRNYFTVSPFGNIFR